MIWSGPVMGNIRGSAGAGCGVNEVWEETSDALAARCQMDGAEKDGAYRGRDIAAQE